MNPTLTFPIIMMVVGAILGLIALVPQVPTPWGTLGPLTARMRWVAGVVGSLLVALAVFIYSYPEHTPSPTNHNSQTVLPPPATGDTNELTDKLIDVVRGKQHEKVRDSTGTLDYQCFTEAKFAEFKKAATPSQVAEDLKKDASFIDLVLAIRAMAPTERQKLLERVSKTYRQAWSQLGLNPATDPPDKLLQGQTDAGSEAEQLIAKSIVDLVKDLCRRSESDVRKLSM